MMGFLLKIFAITVSLSGIAFGGLLDLFSDSTDYNIEFLMDTVFGIVTNDTNFIVEGDANISMEEDVRIWCGNRNLPNLSQTIIDDPSLGSKIDTSRPLVFITHGWLDNGNRIWVKLLTADYLKFVDTNICVVDWGDLALYGYAAAVKHTFSVGEYVAQFITYLTNNGVPLSSITLVGHSLGAQISGHIGRNLGGQIGAIYGLDPAGPLFTMPTDVGPTKRLDKSDAKFVQIIITSKCACGVCLGDGHENFYPTGGWVPQPNCALPLLSNAESPEWISCSHAHAISLFRMALNPSNVFKVNRDYVSPTRMGIYSNRIAGNYYVKTSAFEPFT